MSVIVTFGGLAAYVNAPEPTFDQSRDWVVATIAESAGYTHDATAVTYKDVSMEGCQLRFTTFTTTPTGYSDAETTTFSLDSVKTIIWGTASNPLRGYVIFTAAAPISLNRQTVGLVLDRQPQTINASTTIAYLEFGKPGAVYPGLASHLKAAIFHTADLSNDWAAPR